MTMSHETDRDAARLSQETFAYPLKIWADWAQNFFEPRLVQYTKRTHRAEEVVDHYFNILERILNIQREVAKCVVESYSWTATKAASAMHDVARDARDAAAEVSPKRDTHDGARETVSKKS